MSSPITRRGLARSCPSSDWTPAPPRLPDPCAAPRKREPKRAREWGEAVGVA